MDLAYSCKHMSFSLVKRKKESGWNRCRFTKSRPFFKGGRKERRGRGMCLKGPTRPLSGFINQWVGTRPKRVLSYVCICLSALSYRVGWWFPRSIFCIKQFFYVCVCQPWAVSVCVCVHYVYRPALLKFWKKRERPDRSSERGGVLFCPVTQSRHAYPIFGVRASRSKQWKYNFSISKRNAMFNHSMKKKTR